MGDGGGARFFPWLNETVLTISGHALMLIPRLKPAMTSAALAVGLVSHSWDFWPTRELSMRVTWKLELAREKATCQRS
jgi:hypothetical protein